MYDTTNESVITTPANASGAQPGLPLLLAFDKPLLQAAFSALAARDRRFRLVTAGHSGHKGHAGAGELSGVVLLDGACDPDWARALLATYRPMAGVLLSDLADAGAPEAAPIGPSRLHGVEFAVLGYSTTWPEVSRALQRAARGYLDVSKAVRAKTTDGDDASKSRLDDDLRLYHSLSKREKELLAGLGVGRSTSQIADKLNIAVSTAENHKSRLMKKIDVHKSVDLVRFAIRVGAAPL